MAQHSSVHRLVLEAVETSQETLPNGLRVIAISLQHLHTVTLALYVKAGSRFESKDDNGLSHFVEHMLFRGTESYPSSFQFNVAVEGLGAGLYAETGRDYSLFQMALEPLHLDAGMQLLGELMGRPIFADIELERAIILEELNEDFDERGREINGDDIARELVFAGHGLGQRIIGPRENVRRFSVADVKRHFAAMYGAKNLLLCVAGPVSGERVFRCARTAMAHIAPGKSVSPRPPAIEQTRPRYRYVEDSGSQTSVHLLLRGVDEAHPLYPATLALMRALDDGMSTPLHYRLCDQLGLAYSAHAGIEPLHDISLFDITATTAHSKIVPFTQEALALLTQFCQHTIGDPELAKIQRRYRFEAMSSIDDGSAMVSWFGISALHGRPETLNERLTLLERIKPTDIQTAARHIFRPERLTVVAVGSLSKASQGALRQAIEQWDPVRAPARSE